MSSSNGTTFGYRLYVRSKGQSIIITLKDGTQSVVGSGWIMVPIANDRGGVANPLYCRIASEEARLVAFSTAKAIAAQLTAMIGFQVIEFRLEKVKVTYSWKAASEGYSAPFAFGIDVERDTTFTTDDAEVPRA